MNPPGEALAGIQTVIAPIFLGEPAPPSLWLGLALVMGGIFLVNWPRKKKAILRD